MIEIMSGYRVSSGGTYSAVGLNTYWWSSTPSGSNAYGRHLNYSIAQFNRSYWTQSNGFSVRCLRNLAGNAPIKFCD